MNKDRIRQLAEHLRKPETAGHFNMEYFCGTIPDGETRGASVGEVIHACGTVACIAGHALALFAPMTEITGWMVDAGAEALEIDDEEVTDALFTPEGLEMGNGVNAYKATNLQAARVLDHLAETGEVDWSVAK